MQNFSFEKKTPMKYKQKTSLKNKTKQKITTEECLLQIRYHSKKDYFAENHNFVFLYQRDTLFEDLKTTI